MTCSPWYQIWLHRFLLKNVVSQVFQVHTLYITINLWTALTICHGRIWRFPNWPKHLWMFHHILHVMWVDSTSGCYWRVGSPSEILNFWPDVSRPKVQTQPGGGVLSGHHCLFVYWSNFKQKASENSAANIVSYTCHKFRDTNRNHRIFVVMENTLPTTEAYVFLSMVTPPTSIQLPLKQGIYSLTNYVTYVICGHKS